MLIKRKDKFQWERDGSSTGTIHTEVVCRLALVCRAPLYTTHSPLLVTKRSGWSWITLPWSCKTVKTSSFPTCKGKCIYTGQLGVFSSLNILGTLPSTGQYSASESSRCPGDTVTDTGSSVLSLGRTSLHSCDSCLRMPFRLLIRVTGSETFLQARPKYSTSIKIVTVPDGQLIHKYVTFLPS